MKYNDRELNEFLLLDDQLSHAFATYAYKPDFCHLENEKRLIVYLDKIEDIQYLTYPVSDNDIRRISASECIIDSRPQYLFYDIISDEIHFKKARGFYGEEAESFKARLQTYEDGIQWETAPITATTFYRVIEMSQQGHKQQEIAKILNIHKSNVSRHLARAKQEGKLRGCAL